MRAHLIALEQDGLVKQSGVRRGFRKPHFAYGLTLEGERLFPKAYDLLLNELLAVLKGLLAPQALEGVLRKVGSSLAQRQSSRKTGGVESRARSASRVPRGYCKHWAELRLLRDRRINFSSGAEVVHSKQVSPNTRKFVRSQKPW